MNFHIDQGESAIEKKVMRFRVLFFFIFLFKGTCIFPSDYGSLKIKQLETAFYKIDKGYAKSRYRRSAASLLSGFFRCKTARNMLNDENSLKYEKFAAYSLLGFSSIRYVDGIKGLFFKSSIEKFLLKFRGFNNQQKIMHGEDILKKIAEYGKRDRLYHLFMRAASGGLYLYLFLKDKDKYRKYLYSTLIYAGLATINLFTRSKPEKIWKSYKKKNIRQEKKVYLPDTQFYISPTYKGFRTGVLMTF